ncbi:MAG TPA: MscL family protein [Candidatus Pacearchaeota archaeon]|nr:MscL family protein [Candidatus Pacearchaeota archaeon]
MEKEDKKETKEKKGLIKEFLEFLKEYKVVGLAIAFIMGVAATALVKSLVDNIIMPLITPFIADGAWKTATFTLGPFVIGWGAFLGEAINFVIIALVIFFIAKAVLKEEKVTKK